MPRIKSGGQLWGKPAKDIILKDIIESKVQRIKELETKQQELEKKQEN